MRDDWNYGPSFARIFVGAVLLLIAMAALAYVVAASAPGPVLRDAGAARVPRAKPWAHLTGGAGP